MADDKKLEGLLDDRGVEYHTRTDAQISRYLLSCYKGLEQPCTMGVVFGSDVCDCCKLIRDMDNLRRYSSAEGSPK